MVKLKITKKMIGKVIVADKDYIVYKKVTTSSRKTKSGEVGIAVLLIPKGSKIVVPSKFKKDTTSLHSKKLRAEKAFCLYILPMDRSHVGFGYKLKYVNTYLDLKTKRNYCSIHRSNFKYSDNKMITPKQPFSEDTFTACRSGIHFFTEVQDAENY